jgi:hypothetical protein
MKTGDLLPGQPVVKLLDADGYEAKGASGLVTVSIDPSSGTGGNLSEGLITATVSEGVARFSGVKLVGTPTQQGVTGQTYRLRFSFTNEANIVITSPESEDLTVTNAAAASLTLIRSASSGQAGEVFDTQPIVHITDRYGNLVETGSDAVLTVEAY